jgi:serine/threonine protein kinase
MAPQTLAPMSHRYKVERLLGRGGMGEVFEATHVRTGRRVALKRLVVTSAATSAPGDTERFREALARFAREAKAAGKIRSPHVVEVLDADVDPDDGAPYMVMEFLTGRDLSAYLQSLGPLPVRTALAIAAQASRGLYEAHRVGVIHRDIKPANLVAVTMPTGELCIKVVDFGIARLQAADEVDLTQDLTHTGSMLGSPAYMAPEQARGVKDIDARVDVWSLGVVLYKLLAGRAPHERPGAAIAEVLLAICTTPAPHVQDVAPWVPPEVAHIVHRALRIEPGLRFASMNEFLTALLQVLPEDADSLMPDDMRRLTEAERAVVEDRAEITTEDLASTLDFSRPRSRRAARATRRKWIVLGAVFSLGFAGSAALAVTTLLGRPSLSGSEVRHPDANVRVLGATSTAVAALPAVSSANPSPSRSAPNAVPIPGRNAKTPVASAPATGRGSPPPEAPIPGISTTFGR